MKLENIQKSQILFSRQSNLIKARRQLEVFLQKKTKNGYGNEASNGEHLYSFILSEYADHSGCKADLTDCCVGVEILEFALQSIQRKLEALNLEIIKL